MEVILIPVDGCAYSNSILHVCGGDPFADHRGLIRGLYSPRVWRWSLKSDDFKLANAVFSTCVEVILIGAYSASLVAGILHVCGGDPHLNFDRLRPGKYSPRVWRWSWSRLLHAIRVSVFSTCVEVILRDGVALKLLKSILHVCGGDPNRIRADRKIDSVFSTCVEVILTLPSLLKLARCILHVCGGDPELFI